MEFSQQSQQQKEIRCAPLTSTRVWSKYALVSRDVGFEKRRLSGFLEEVKRTGDGRVCAYQSNGMCNYPSITEQKKSISLCVLVRGPESRTQSTWLLENVLTWNWHESRYSRQNDWYPFFWLVLKEGFTTTMSDLVQGDKVIRLGPGINSRSTFLRTECCQTNLLIWSPIYGVRRNTRVKTIGATRIWALIYRYEFSG